MTPPVDYSALVDPVSEAEVAAYRARSKAAGAPRSNGAGAIFLTVFVILAFAGMIYGIVAYNTVPAVVALFEQGFTPYTVLSALTFLFVIALLLLMAWIISLALAGRKTWENWLRLSRFASDNGLLFSYQSPNPDYPGVIFQQGDYHFALNHIRSTEGRYFDLGSYQYITGSGRGRQAHNWGFLALKLDRRLPHMLLDATANNTFMGSNLPELYNAEQVLHLEGDFDRHFTLYCPKEYERDALYVFTPDLMALLIDNAAPFDAEIVDDWLFVYSAKAIAVTDAAAWERLFRVIETVGAKTLSQTARYSDERVADPSANIVAPRGARLRTRISVVSIVIVVLYTAFSVVRILV